MSTGCEVYSDRLADYAAGRLDGEARGRLAVHLDTCAACREELAVIEALRRAPVAPPAGLEARVQRAVRAAAGAAELSEVSEVAGVAGVAGGGPLAADNHPAAVRPESRGGVRSLSARRARRWAPWALPLAAAAGLAVVWVGVGAPGTGSPSSDEAAVVEEFRPYGAMPAGDGVVAGEPLLSELSVEDLERLLEEM